MILVAFRYNDTRPFARFVCWWMGGDSAHCEVAHRVDDAYDCISSSFLDGGVRRKLMPLPANKWRIYQINSVNVAGAHDFLSDHEGEGYDFLGLLGFFIRRVRGARRRWFCSEVAATVLGLREAHRYDLNTLESVCAWRGRRVQ